jgi:hypothetical protein
MTIIQGAANLYEEGDVLAAAAVVTSGAELITALEQGSRRIFLSDTRFQATLLKLVQTAVVVGGLVGAWETVHHAIEEKYSIGGEVSIKLRKWSPVEIDGKVLLTPPREP